MGDFMLFYIAIELGNCLRNTMNLRGLSVYTPILKRNGDFALIFWTLWFCPYVFELKEEFAPTLVQLTVLIFRRMDKIRIVVILPLFQN